MVLIWKFNSNPILAHRLQIPEFIDSIGQEIGRNRLLGYLSPVNGQT